MPGPVTPIVPGASLPVVTFAAEQPQYLPLPAYRAEDGTVLTRWKFSWIERLRLLFTGNLYIWLLTFNLPLQPISLQVEKPAVSLEGEKA